VLATYARKPIFGYAAMAFAFAAISFVSFTVWAHHMFATGISPVADAVFAATSFLVAVPTGIKIFNWLGTIWKGSIQMTTAFLFAAGFIGQFTIGGLGGVMLATVPVDWQITDTYFVVGHFHYVLFSGAVLALFAGTYHWFPKMTGKFMNERLGVIHFWLTMVGMVMVFLVMHYVGVIGMPRRIYAYSAGQGWDLWNLIESAGAVIIAVGVVIFVWNIIISLRQPKTATDDPWGGQTLEWATSSPPPVYNFATMIPVTSPRPLWDAKYGAHGEFAENPKTIDLSGGGQAHIHLPNPSFWPLLLSLALTIFALGLIYGPQTLYIVAVVGVIGIFLSFLGWLAQPAG
jgi:cytochrome c oxidase subunit 1